MIKNYKKSLLIKVNIVNLILTILFGIVGVIILCVSMGLYSIPITDKVYYLSIVAYIIILIIIHFNDIFEIHWDKNEIIYSSIT